MKDPIIEEVRRVRKKIEAEHGTDWDSLARHLIEVQDASSAKVVSYPPRKLSDRDVA
ncbi:MAG: hypothetical protein JW741_08145 [Sedimentisphaerales bacterium]|nr:hypothetical protein [Sedimentisphaerales bacterium]